MGEQMPDRDRLFAVGRELGDVLGDRIVDLQFSTLPELPDGDRPHRLARGQPQHQMIARERYPRPVLTHRRVRHRHPAPGDGELGAEVEPFAYALFEHPACTGQVVETRDLHGWGNSSKDDKDIKDDKDTKDIP